MLPLPSSPWRAAGSVLALVAALGLPTSALAQAPTAAAGITMGDMVVLSEFGEPLRAEIEIAGLDAAAADSLDAAIGTRADYASLGLRYPTALDGALVRIQRRPGGRVTVRVATRAPIADAELNMVLALTTRGERSLRNYQLVGTGPTGSSMPSFPASPPAAGASRVADPPLRLDLVPVVPQPELPPAASPQPAPSTPASASAAFVPAQPAAVAPPAERPADRPAPAERDPTERRAAKAVRAEPPERRAAQPAAGERNVRVQPGETALAIARRFKPADVDESQAVMALYRRNQALFGGSVHRLPAGVTLALPDETEIRQVPRHEARAAIRGRDDAAPTPAAPRADRLVISGDDAAPAEGRGRMGSASATKAAALDAAHAEADSRIRDLQKNVDDLNRLLELRDRQLAKLQDTAQRLADERSSGVVPAAGPGPVSASGSVSPDGGGTAGITSTSGTESRPAPPPEIRPVAAPMPQPQPAPEPSGTGWFADWRIQAAAGVLAAVFVLAGVAFTLRATRPGGSRGLTGGGRDWRAPAGGGGQPTSVARR